MIPSALNMSVGMKTITVAITQIALEKSDEHVEFTYFPQYAALVSLAAVGPWHALHSAHQYAIPTPLG